MGVISSLYVSFRGPGLNNRHNYVLSVGGGASRGEKVPGPSQVSGCVSRVRQYSGCVVHDEGRWDHIIQTDPAHDQFPQVL